MPSKPKTPCGKCGQPAVRNGKCARHLRQADQMRGTATQRGYDQDHRDLFRAPVLERCDWVCEIPGCEAEATVADHYPRTRREIIAAGDDPNNAAYGRGICKTHHDQSTAKAQRMSNVNKGRF